MSHENICPPDEFRLLCSQNNFTEDDLFGKNSIFLLHRKIKTPVLFAVRRIDTIDDVVRAEEQKSFWGNRNVLGGMLIGPDMIIDNILIQGTVSSALRLERIGKEIASMSMLMHFLTMMGSVQKLDYLDEHVVDFGAGTGPLALAALRRGAVHATLVEMNRERSNAAQQNARLNGFGGQTTCLTGDFTRMFEVDVNSPKATVGFANIGPHEAYGGPGGAHRAVPDVVRDHFPNLHTMVIGGYTRVGSPIDPILEEYARLRFSVDSFGTLIQTGHPDAFISAILHR